MDSSHRDISVSPMAQTPGASIPTGNPPTDLPTASQTETTPTPDLAAAASKALESNKQPVETDTKKHLQEAADYLNGGVPHEDHSPLNGSKQALADPEAPASVPVSQEDGPSPDTAFPGRRSVQFARDDTFHELPSPHSRQGSVDPTDPAGRSRSERFMSKLKSLATSGALQSSPRVGTLSEPPSSTSSPIVNRTTMLPEPVLEEEASDADVEEVADEDTTREPAKGRRRAKMRRRLKQLDLRTLQAVPRGPQSTDSPDVPVRLGGLVRRSTMPEPAEHRGGLSEGEGRDQLIRARQAMRRGTSWVDGGDIHDAAESPRARMVNHRRRISDMFGGGVSDGDAVGTPKRPFFGGERAATFGGQRWRQVKNTIRMLGKRRIDHFDYYKSAELMAELRAVTPAVVILASMLQRDEHGNKRIPVLLEQLNLKVVDSRAEETGQGERHSIFTIALEYGSGPSRMNWTIIRTIRDIANLHLRYRLSLKNDVLQPVSQRSRPKQPKFPVSAFPYLRNWRGLGDSDDEDRAADGPVDDITGDLTAGEATGADFTASDAERRPNARRKKSRINLLGNRRQSSTLGDITDGNFSNPQRTAAEEAALIRRRFIERQRRMLEKYLQEMIRWLMFRPDSNRLCRFLELSALGVRLAAEGSYHGKECFLHIQSTGGIDFRRVFTPSKVIARHSRKWFLVRQNYIVVVDSPANMNIYDVYLVDPHFRIVSKKNKLKQLGAKAAPKKGKANAKDNDDQLDDVHDDEDDSHETHHTLKLYTSERKIKLFSRNQTLMRQFEESVSEMLRQTSWHQPHRFDSFAPVRHRCHAQWLVDGRDYMWNLSRAISMAQDVIYIHDWWLSPELYLRRPAAISQKWRLDRLLQKKAREGVKIFVIIYRNVEQAIPIDSEYSKFSLLNLHPNIMVLRSPNQLKKNQFFYAHHEKICVVDHDVAFVGGIDLCFGRWDSPQHPLADDRPTGFEPEGDTPKDAEHCQLFPGKDYSNPRVLDFFKLYEPYEEMYDRSKTPRMPWHDIAMQVVGQPARDLTRHFVQRWNYLRRERKPTRPTPFLLPPPDANQSDLEAVGLTGTCEVQILRSASDWSLGLVKDTYEASIQAAYIKLIEESEHFVYIENQFFISSTETMNTKVVNRVGDALVERAIRAHERNEAWLACILIPLMPGFQNTVDEQDGTSVRLIMQFQFRSICRGPNSVFGRLIAKGIDPEDYIQFYSLRTWGHIGVNNLVTEQLYIHAKAMIVDDRVALIGSANINERSMLGLRDSECAAIVRDTDMINSTMAGRPYRVGRFAHSMRMRLMREHLGLDVDEITEQERQAEIDAAAKFEAEMNRIYDEEPEDSFAESSRRAGSSRLSDRPKTNHRHTRSFNRDAVAIDEDESSSDSTSDRAPKASRRKSRNEDANLDRNKSKDEDLKGYGADNWVKAQDKGLDEGRDSVIINGNEVLVQELKDAKRPISSPKASPRLSSRTGKSQKQPMSPSQRSQHSHHSVPVADDLVLPEPAIQDEAARPATKDSSSNPLLADIQQAEISKDCMRDPVDPAFWDEIWNRVASNNTKLFRRVFRCMPDSEVSTYADYREYVSYAARFNESMTGRKKSDEHDGKSQASVGGGAGGVGIAAPANAGEAIQLTEKISATPAEKPKDSLDDEAVKEKPAVPEKSEAGKKSVDTTYRESKRTSAHITPQRSPYLGPGDATFPAYNDTLPDIAHLDPESAKQRERRTTFSNQEKPSPVLAGNRTPTNGHSIRRRRRATTKSSRRGPIFPYDVLGREEAEELCNNIQGSLVQFPYDWLEGEEKDNRWLYQADLLAPKEI